MTLYSVSIAKLEKYVDKNWTVETYLRPMHSKVHARAAHLILAPFSMIPSALDAIIGIGAALLYTGSFGSSQTLQARLHHSKGLRYLLVRPYVNLLQALNPQAKFYALYADYPYIAERLAGYARNCDSTKENFIPMPLISSGRDGFISGYVASKIDPPISETDNTSRNFLKKQVLTRLNYALLSVALVVSHVADAAIGGTAVLLSLATFGSCMSLNNLAFRALQAPILISDLFYCATKFLNPGAHCHRI